MLQDAIEVKCSTEAELQEKSQCDKMVEETDGQLDEKNSLELELSKLRIGKLSLKLKLENEVKEKEALKHEVLSLCKKMKSVKEGIQQKANNTLTPVANSNGIRDLSNPNTSFKFTAAVFYFSNNRENESSRTPSLSTAEKVLGTPLLKSDRLPSPGNSALLERNTLELDAMSDSSEQNGSVSFFVRSDAFKRNLYPGGSGPPRQYGNLHNKVQGPAVKSPGAAMKLAARKRLRDVGWTAVTNKRKRKALEMLFA